MSNLKEIVQQGNKQSLVIPPEEKMERSEWNKATLVLDEWLKRELALQPAEVWERELNRTRKHLKRLEEEEASRKEEWLKQAQESETQGQKVQEEQERRKRKKEQEAYQLKLEQKIREEVLREKTVTVSHLDSDFQFKHKTIHIVISLCDPDLLDIMNCCRPEEGSWDVELKLGKLLEDPQLKGEKREWTLELLKRLEEEREVREEQQIFELNRVLELANKEEFYQRLQERGRKWAKEQEALKERNASLPIVRALPPPGVNMVPDATSEDL